MAERDGPATPGRDGCRGRAGGGSRRVDASIGGAGGDARGRAIEGALVLRTSVLGAPDVGTIYESVEIVGDTDSGPEFIACIEAAMYDWVGPAPVTPFETTTTVTHLGRNPEGQDEEVWRRRMFESVVQAHLSEVRACEEEADETQEGVAGIVTLSMGFGTEPFATEVVLDASTVSDAVSACVLDAARAWSFPRPVLADHTFTRQFVLPIDPAVDGQTPDRPVD